MLKSKGHEKVAAFREGESDEYNSEVDGEPSIEMPAINYDLLDVKSSKHHIHDDLINLVKGNQELPEDWEDMLTYK